MNPKLLSGTGPILFDIDRTLFDTDQFVKNTQTSAAKHLNVDLETLQKAKQEYTKTLTYDALFQPIDYTNHLGRTFGVDPEPLLSDFLHTQEHYRSAVFSESHEVLRALKQEKTLGVFSEGNLDFQRKKLEHTRLLSHFDPHHIYISERKLDPRVLDTIPKDAVIIDDKPIIIEALHQMGRSAIWMNRKSKKKHPKVPTIFHLSELLE